MNQYGIQFEVKNKPSLDPEFMPILKFNRAFLETAKKPVSIALERSGGQVAVCDTFIHGTPGDAPRPTNTTSTAWSSPCCG